MSTYRQAVKRYEKLCKQKDVPAETVLAYLVELSNQERYNLYMHYEEEMDPELERRFDEGMARILNHEPMGHVLGYSWFYGYRFLVNPDVLIPRPETEELCGRILGKLDRYFPDQPQVECADIGTGSGDIAITLAKEEKRVIMHATDISEDALKTARENARINDAQVDFMAGDMLKPLIECGIKLDILACNPPYIPAREQLEDTVYDYEPHVALFGGEDGLKFYREVFRDCGRVLKPKSFMAFEMGWDQRERLSALVREMLPDAGWEVLKDMNGKDRMLFVYFGCAEQ